MVVETELLEKIVETELLERIVEVELPKRDRRVVEASSSKQLIREPKTSSDDDPFEKGTSDCVAKRRLSQADPHEST